MTEIKRVFSDEYYMIQTDTQIEVFYKNKPLFGSVEHKKISNKTDSELLQLLSQISKDIGQLKHLHKDKPIEFDVINVFLTAQIESNIEKFFID